jgi:3-dehydroquinate synthase
LESAASFRGLKHGEAVGHGMIAAVRISAVLGRMQQADAEKVVSAVRSIGVLPPLKGTKMVPLMKALLQDKKVKDGSVHFVLPRAIGQVEITKDVPLAVVREIVGNLIHERKTGQ